MKVKKMYSRGGKTDEKVLTKDGKKRNNVSDADLAAGRADSKRKLGSKATANDKRDAQENVKVANEILAELKKEYQALTPEERKGEKGKAIREKMQTERDAKRGNAKYYGDVAVSGSGKKVRLIGSTGR
jgi:hypothetical protein